MQLFSIFEKVSFKESSTFAAQFRLRVFLVYCVVFGSAAIAAAASAFGVRIWCNAF
jgi:hypothetical protein